MVTQTHQTRTRSHIQPTPGATAAAVRDTSLLVRLTTPDDISRTAETKNNS